MTRPFPVWGWLAILALVASGGAVVYGKTRGLRNNNPGNLRRSSTQWQGMTTTQSDPDFIQFVSPEYGIRALARVLQTYVATGYKTVRQIITRWAPPTENDTNSYVNAVASSLNVQPDTTLDMSRSLPSLVKAIIRHENGIQPYPDDLITRGISLA